MNFVRLARTHLQRVRAQQSPLREQDSGFGVWGVDLVRLDLVHLLLLQNPHQEVCRRFRVQGSGFRVQG